MSQADISKVAGIILAGGRSRRFGPEDKCLVSLGGMSLVERCAARALNQVSALAVCADAPPQRFAFLGLPVLADAVPGYRGPLSAVLAGMEWATRDLPHVRWIATFPADGPFCPPDLVARLIPGGEQPETPVIAATEGETHQAFGLWPISLAAALRDFLVGQGRSKVLDFAEAQDVRAVVFPEKGDISPFFNINTKEDLARAEAVLKADE